MKPAFPFQSPHATAGHILVKDWFLTLFQPPIQDPDGLFCCHSNLIRIIQMLPCQIGDLQVTNADLLTADTVHRVHHVSMCLFMNAYLLLLESAAHHTKLITKFLAKTFIESFSLCNIFSFQSPHPASVDLPSINSYGFFLRIKHKEKMQLLCLRIHGWQLSLPPLCTRLKYLISYWVHCHEIFYFTCNLS